MGRFIRFIKRLGNEMKNDRATGLAAEQAYYYMLSVFPLLVLALSIIPYLNIDPQKVIEFLQTIMPPETVSVFEENINDFVNKPNGGLLTVGILGTIWSASNGMNAFIGAMNQAFNVEESRPFYLVRLLSIGLTIGLIFAFLIAFFLPVFGGIIIRQLENIIYIPGSTAMILNVLRFIIAFFVIFTIITTLYRIAPNVNKTFKELFPGAIVATVIWQMVSIGFSFYVSNFGNYSATYGSLGGVIILMLWLFLTGLALVIGGEINAIYHKDRLRTEIEYHDEKFTAL
ncbi:YihY/virulence factor BrkB family protein [Sutcliffiella horikoshii]|uniref:YihY/virulence factor BrkB family protein n=1 Tax=Sutcliffiella horikoshii TaxID=79883 RepID=UPI001F47F57D|nr:YihY/virulence factor BrkB family protein [Sutcliffiella horikoshii]MCG1020924.1 YihY/virulence factor BrkB family protein [Sutcliffiella horikoshii]